MSVLSCEKVKMSFRFFLLFSFIVFEEKKCADSDCDCGRWKQVLDNGEKDHKKSLRFQEEIKDVSERERENETALANLSSPSLFSPPSYQYSFSPEDLLGLFWSSSEGHEECNVYPQEEMLLLLQSDWRWWPYTLKNKNKNTFRKLIDWITLLKVSWMPRSTEWRRNWKRVSKSSSTLFRDSTANNQLNKPT